MHLAFPRLACCLFLLPVLAAGGCGGEQEAQRSRMPSWFALIPVEAEGDHRLVLDPEPRWFHGMPKLVSLAELERQRQAAGIVVLEARRAEEGGRPGMRWVPTSPPLSAYLDGLPKRLGGVRLELEARLLPTSGDLELRLTLHAGERPLWREKEHRAENAHPFLIGLYADDEPLRRPHRGSAKCGGVSRFHEVVAAGSRRSWTLVVRRSSVEALLGNRPTRELSVVAAFSERQHDSTTLSEGARLEPDPSLEPPFGNDQFVIRSPCAKVNWRP